MVLQALRQFGISAFKLVQGVPGVVMTQASITTTATVVKAKAFGASVLAVGQGTGAYIVAAGQATGPYALTAGQKIVEYPTLTVITIGALSNIPYVKDVMGYVEQKAATSYVDGVIELFNRAVIPTIQHAMDRSTEFVNSIATDPAKITIPLYGEGAPKNMVGLDQFVLEAMGSHPVATGTTCLIATGAFSYIAYHKYKDNEKVNNAISKTIETISKVFPG